MVRLKIKKVISSGSNQKVSSGDEYNSACYTLTCGIKRNFFENPTLKDKLFPVNRFQLLDLFVSFKLISKSLKVNKTNKINKKFENSIIRIHTKSTK